MREENKKKLPLWGPYSKKYMGLSRVMRESTAEGARFDLVLSPTYAYSAVPVPNVTVPSAYHPWECGTDGKYYRYRYELQWKDQLYADTDLYEIDGETWGVRIRYCNETEQPQECMLNLFAAMEYPDAESVVPVRPEKSDHWKALAYEEYSFGRKRPWEELSFDGLRRGEQPFPGFTEGKALAETVYEKMYDPDHPRMFGAAKGDRVSYRRRLEHSYENPVLTVRYATYEAEEALCFETDFGPVEFPPSKEPAVVTVSLPAIRDEDFFFEMRAAGSERNGLLLDCFTITEREDARGLCFRKEKRNLVPEISYKDDQVIYQYHYGEPAVRLGILDGHVRRRRLDSGCLEDAPVTRLTNSDHTYDNLTQTFSGSFREKHSDEGFYHVNVVDSILVPGKSSSVRYVYVSTKDVSFTEGELEAAWRERYEEAHRADGELNPAGSGYQFSAGLMKSALFSNAVYPIFRHGEPVIHYTPGKRWDSLYTWDSGFIGMGMLEYSEERAEYILDTYLSEEDNRDFAFLAHGSLVPTQFYLWYDLLMRGSAGRRAELKKYYPMLRRYYEFMAGRGEGSTMFRLKSGMPTVYDYFYNASGMDDYPPQAAMHRQGLSRRIAPVCSSAHFIRIARIMYASAEYYGLEDDLAVYAGDIRRVSGALLENAWDEESGYFGYVLHTEAGEPEGIFRTADGENLNRGVDGVTPLIAGVWTGEQKSRMLAHLKTKGELGSERGISTVDQSAGYYDENGYWNGSVWFPYQYLLWRSMLDLGEADFAWQIADTALRTWKQEAEFSYNTVEMIKIRTGRGGWFHQFSGLSAPIVIWYHAYYRRGTVTAGYDTWIEESRMEDGCRKAKIRFRTSGRGGHVIIAVMDPADRYEVKINGEKAEYKEHAKGALEIKAGAGAGEILITAI